MKITKNEAKKARASAIAEHAAIYRDAGKKLSVSDKRKIKGLNAVIEAADQVMKGK